MTPVDPEKAPWRSVYIPVWRWREQMGDKALLLQSRDGALPPLHASRAGGAVTGQWRPHRRGRYLVYQPGTEASRERTGGASTSCAICSRPNRWARRSQVSDERIHSARPERRLGARAGHEVLRQPHADADPRPQELGRRKIGVGHRAEGDLVVVAFVREYPDPRDGSRE